MQFTSRERMSQEGAGYWRALTDRSLAGSDYRLLIDDVSALPDPASRFQPEGALGSTRERFGYLQDLGVTAVELMPVEQFPGRRNWGYDGVHPFAVQNSYSGPAALQQFVDACHGDVDRA